MIRKQNGGKLSAQGKGETTVIEERLNYDEPIEIAEGIFWVGFSDNYAGFHCNPYLIVDGQEAVLLDSGSRSDFSTVMLKIMRAGVAPNQIRRLIYHHYDPDLCANLPHMEALIHSEDLRIISHYENNLFINYYSTASPKDCIEKDLGFEYRFSSGRRLTFILTPYAHCPGSFMTYDTKTKILFSSDIFGGYDTHWDLYTQIGEECRNCAANQPCPHQKRCEIQGMLEFHRRSMTSTAALNYALDQIEELDISLIAPQHGSILHTPISRQIAIQQLRALDSVGIDYYLKEVGADATQFQGNR